MSDSFDPYFKWFGIPPDEQPPHHYRLLGISLLEEDCDVIQTAVDRQMMHLKTLRTGKNGRAAEQILNEVSKAKLCLLDKKEKAAYDAKLKSDLHLDQPRSKNAGTDKGDAGIRRKPRSAVPARPGNATEQPSQSERQVAEPEVVAPVVSVGAKRASSVATKYKRRRRKGTPVWIFSAALGTVAVGLIVAGVVVFDRQRSKPTSPPRGAKVVADDSHDSFSDVTRSRHRRNVTDHQQDPKPAQPRTAMVPDKDDGELPVAGELQGKNRSTPSGSDSPPSPQVSASDPMIYLDDADPVDYTVLATLGRHGATGMPQGHAQRCRFRGAEVEHAISMHPPANGSSTVRYRLGGKFREFVATAGLLEQTGVTSAATALVFKVYGDGRLLWESSPLQKTGEGVDCKVVVADVQLLKLEVDCPGPATCAWAAWIDARLLRSDAPATPDTTTPTIEPPPQVARRLPVPDDKSQKRARSQIMRFYKGPISQAQTPEQKLELANNILIQIDETNDIGERFALFQLAGSLAAKAGDAQFALDTVAKMSEVFDVDDLEEQVSLLTEILPNVMQRDSLAHLAQRSAILADQAIRRDKYAAAERLISIAKQATRSAQEMEFLRHLIDRGKEIKAIRSAFNRAERALASLEEDPQDAAANQVVGEYLCFFKQEWQRGLPQLAQSKDPTLRDLASREIAATAGEADALLLGHGWWEVAQKERGPGRKGLELRAAYWYRQALPDLSDEAKAQVEMRLQEIELKYPAPKPLAPLPAKKPADEDKPAEADNVHPVLKYALKPHPGDAVPFERHFYKVFRGRVTWNEAQRHCAAMGGYLVCIGSDNEARFVRNRIGESRRRESRDREREQDDKDRIWIGGIKTPNGDWRWISGEQSTYVNWATFQPDNGLGNENFLRIDKEGEWHDAPFNAANNKGFICEWEL